MRFLLAAAALLAALTHAHEVARRQTKDPPRRVVCYYTNWSVYRKGLAKYTPQNINPYLCTHLVYAFGGLTDEFEVKPFDSYQDIEQGGYAKFNSLKQYNKGLKTLLAIGGWNEGSGRFSELVSLPELRKTFIISAIKHLRRYNFDGLDLDWEYPASRDGSAPEDRENYALLVSELRAAFNDEGKKVKGGRLLLTMAVPAGQNYIDKGYDVPSLTRDLDFFNILNYDYHSAYEPSINHHAALMAPPGTSEYAWNAQLNVDWTVKYYIELGADADKLVIGIPTYGRSYTLIDGNFTDFGSSADGPGEQGAYTKEKGFMAFYEVCENIASHGWSVRKPFPRRIGPYAYSENQWVGYDDEKIVARKAEYVKEHGLGGIMYWSLDNDDFRGICNGEQYPLVEAGKKALFGIEGGVDESLNEARNLQKAPAPAQETRRPASLSSRLKNRRRPSASTTTTTTTPRPTTTARTPTQAGPSTRRRPGTRRRPAGGRRSTTTTIDPFNTPAPPTTPKAITGFACRREGFFPNPDDCHKYYWCLNSGASGLGIVAHAFTCPSDLVFSKTIDGCDHPTRAKCSTNNRNRGGASATTPATSTAIPTTTEIPVDYSYLDDFYQDDYYYYDYEDEAPVEESPDVDNRRFQNSGGNQFSKDSTAVTETPEAQEAPAAEGGLGARTRPQYSSISRDRAQTPAPATEEADAPSRQDSRGAVNARPQYTSITRERPAAPVQPEEAGETSEGGTTTGRRQYVNIERQRPATQSRPTQPEGAKKEADSSTTGRREYATIERQRPAVQTPPTQLESEAREAIPSTGDLEYATIERQRPAAQPKSGTRDGGDPSTGDLEYVVIERQRPATSSRVTPASETLFPTEPTLEYVTITRSRVSPTATLPLSGTEATVSAAEGLEGRAPSTPRYVTIQRERPATPATTDAPLIAAEPEVTSPPVEEVTRPLPRIRVPTSRPRNPTPQRNFFRSRATTTVAPTEPDTQRPESRERPRRPLVEVAPRPIRPEEETVSTLPATELPEVPETSPVTFIAPTEEEPLDVLPEDDILLTTYSPETSVSPVVSSVKPSLFSLFTAPRTTPAVTTPAPTTPTPTTPAPTTPVSTTPPKRPRITRPLRPRKRPTPPTIDISPQLSPQPTPRPTPRAKPQSTPRSKPPPRSSRPSRPAFTRLHQTPAPSGPPASAILEGDDYYDYYYDDLDGALTGTLGDLASLTDKAVLMPDGSVQCYDTGYFTHPDSCKKFISCSKTVRGLVRGWVYTCPQNLVFDPVGGMCNWAEAVDCQ